MAFVSRRPAGRAWQRGAISTMAASGLALILAAGLLAVDLGSLFQTRRQLQNVADMAALSAINNLSPVLNTAQAQARAVALDSARLNNFPVPGGNNNQLVSVVGAYDFRAKTFTAGAGAGDLNAVQVTVSTTQPYFFMFGSRDISATATAASSDLAGLSLGTALIDIDTQKSVLLNGLLGKLLHTSLDLGVASFRGLATTSVRLLDLVKAEASVGTVEKLLALDLTLADLLKLTATALSQSDLATVDASVIDTLNLLSLKSGGDLSLKLGDLVDVSLAPGNTAAEANINLLQLVTLAAQVANGKNFINVPALGLNLGGLAKLDVALTMIEPPSIAIGPPGRGTDGKWRTQAHTSQWRVKLNLVIGEVLGGLVNLPLYLEVAAGDAWLKSIDCRYPRDASIVDVGVSASALRAYVGNVNADAMTNRSSAATVSKATILNVLGLVTVDARAEVNLPGGAADLSFTGPFNASNTQSVNGLSTSGLFNILANSLILDVKLLGLDLQLGTLLDALRAVLNPVFVLLDSILAPVLSLLGIQLGIADVTVFSLTCGAPQLVR